VAERVGVLVVGGGIVGTALAWALAERGVRGVCVLDLDLSGVYASSELNAGGVRATWWQPVNIETCRETLDFFRAHAEQFGFQERGYLWLYEDAALYAQAREKRGLQNQAGLGVELLEPADVAARFPLLELAGKGHETYQIVGEEKRSFDEREIVADLLRGAA
jgi:sarcosine oxidase subunit beta